MKTGKLITLSEQNLIDCSLEYGNSGCKSGTMNGAFKYINKSEGINTEEAYPYEAREVFFYYFILSKKLQYMEEYADY